MKAVLARLLVRIYPKAWRERYGEEFAALLENERGGLRGGWGMAADVVRSAICEHIFPVRGGVMIEHTWSLGRVTRQPSAFVPLAMSILALAMLAVAIALGGAARATDEGAIAHLWQLLMAGQAPVVLFFALRWLRRARRQAVQVLVMQAGGMLATCAAVFLLGLG